MKSNQIISLEEQKKIRFEILSEVDSFCREKGIRYSLAFGTLLGAVRHHGFIPWDDDLDIMMPLPDLKRFKTEFQSDKIKFCDIDTDNNYRCAFPNLGFKATYRKGGMISSFFGVGIDVYPIIGIPEDQNLQNSFFEHAKALQQRREFYLKWQSRVTKYLPIEVIPGYVNAIKSYRDYLYDNSVPYNKAKKFYAIAAPLEIRERTTYKCDIFEKLIDLQFETGNFKCIEKFDYFLTLMYGDYMTLPPVDKRVPHHGQTYYWK